MKGVPVAPRRVFGVHVQRVDAQTADVWVCRAHPGSDGIRVEGIERLAELPGGTAELLPAARSLVGKIAEAPRSAWGFDAGFVPRDAGTMPTVDAASVWLIENVLTPARRLPAVCVLPQDPLPVPAAGMPAAMVAAMPSTYLLEVSPEALRTRLCAEGVAMPELGEAAWREGLRALAAAEQVRPLPRALRDVLMGIDPGARHALLCAVATWRGYRGYDHLRLHADSGGRAEGFVYC